jgi:hypothetical protein
MTLPLDPLSISVVDGEGNPFQASGDYPHVFAQEQVPSCGEF